MHGADQRHTAVVRHDRGGVPHHGDHAVRVLHADGPGHRVRHRSEHIVQRRGVRAQAPGLVDVRPERVLLRRLLFRHHRVRDHQQLEAVAAHHHLRADDEPGGAVAGE